jgi:tetratricopeptide (TPR) repeat protein
MTTHIFLALGMWDDVVSQNVIASGHDHGQWQAGHYTSWLGYGYTQQGRLDEARTHLESMRANYRKAPRRGEEPSLLSMRAHYIINSERWSDPALEWRIDAPNAGPVARAMDIFARAYALLKSGKRSRAVELAKELSALTRRPTRDDFYSSNTSVPEVLSLELTGLLLLDERKEDEGLSALREASRREDALAMEFGPPDIVKPAHELLGEVLLDLKETDEAQKEFQRALELAPGRSHSLLGLGRAAFARGDTAVARKALSDLMRNWHSADTSLPRLSEVAGMLERLK